MSFGSQIHRYLLGGLTSTEVAELDRRLAEDPALRREFVLAAAMDAALRETAMQRAAEPTAVPPAAPPAGVSKRAVWSGLMAIAAALIVAAFGLPWRLGVDSVGTIASSENAAWESSLPTMPGSTLGPGSLKLKSGVATIRFRSGAEVLLEAPAELELVTSMRGKLLSGAAVIEVPESATGFVLETPGGYAVDYGTQFAAQVDERRKRSDFQLIEGEIAIHHPHSGDVVRLVGHERSATLSEQSLRLGDVENRDEPGGARPRVVRIGTHGRTGSAIQNNKRDKFIDREVLTVKATNSNDWGHRSFFAFDLSAVDMDLVRSVRLRLNLLPSTRGSTLRWPKVSRFAVHGLTNPAKADWKASSLWEESPGPEDGIRLGTFEIPRSEQRGTFGIRGDRLLEFLKANAGGPVTLIIVRESTQRQGVGPASPHMFASDFHPEAVGPLLEFTLTE